MILTMENYKWHLPYRLRSQFLFMVNNKNRAIIYKDGVLRYANADEY